MKYIDLLNIRADVLDGISKKKIPMSIKFPLMINIERIRECLEPWNKIYSEILLRYCELDGNGDPLINGDQYLIPNERKSEFFEEYNSAAEVDACEIKKISLSVIEDYDEYRFDVLTLEEIQALKFMIE